MSGDLPQDILGNILDDSMDIDINSDYVEDNTDITLSLDAMINDDGYIQNIKELEKSDASLNKLIPKYNKNMQLLEDSLQNKNYILFIVWTFIFILIFVSFLFALLDINQEINLMMRIVIYIFIIYVLYYVFNNVINYIKKYV